MPTDTTVCEIDGSDIFREEIKYFVNEIEINTITKDVSKIIKHVLVILKIKESIETGKEVFINDNSIY